MNRKDEISAGAVALAIMFGWLIAVVTTLWLFSDVVRSAVAIWAWPAMLGTVPGGMALIFEAYRLTHQQLVVGVFCSVFLHLILAAFFVDRFGRIENQEVTSPQNALRKSRLADWLGPPRRSPVTAIIWKQFRESVPIAIAGLAIVAGTTALFYIVDSDSRGRIDELAAGVSVSIGFGLAMVVGIGVVLNDMKPGLNTFWRSRPIDADQWFLIKAVTGLAVVLIAIYSPLLILTLLGYHSPLAAAGHPDAWIYPMFHITIFAAAVATTCLVRRAVYAAILSIAAAVAGVFFVGLLLEAAELLGWLERPARNLLDVTEQEALVGLMISLVISTLVAWLAVRNDWGQKALR